MSELRDKIADEYSIRAEDRVLLSGSDEVELRAQAERLQEKTGDLPPRFAFNPGQAAGNGNPVAPRSTVDKGRELYRKNNQR
ncbi:hypothetical protein [Pseudonocardia sp.]|uniref:hypothetical protein n=1 Tax=Pseudonocardia sp. TaxID=60912 RepID=UPI003D0F358E